MIADDHKTHVQFVVTGFGPFKNARINPTAILVERLREYLRKIESLQVEQQQQQQQPQEQSSVVLLGKPLLSETILRTRIIDVSAVDAKAAIDELYDEFAVGQQQINHNENSDASATNQSTSTTTTSTALVLLHLGVNYRGTGFQIERYAYNDADFRIPDERGDQPRKQPVILAPVATTAATATSSSVLDDDNNKNNNMSESVTVRGSTNPVRTSFELGQALETLLDTTSLVERVQQEQDDLIQEQQHQLEGQEPTSTENCHSSKETASENNLAAPSSPTTTAVSATATAPSNTDTATTNHTKVMVSTDPGRFVCNYTYCYSMYKFQCYSPTSAAASTATTTTTAVSSIKPNDDCVTNGNERELMDHDGCRRREMTNTTYSLFVHVPPFEVIPEQEQLHFLTSLMECIRRQVSSRLVVNQD